MYFLGDTFAPLRHNDILKLVIQVGDHPLSLHVEQIQRERTKFGGGDHLMRICVSSDIGMVWPSAKPVGSEKSLQVRHRRDETHSTSSGKSGPHPYSKVPTSHHHLA